MMQSSGGVVGKGWLILGGCVLGAMVGVWVLLASVGGALAVAGEAGGLYDEGQEDGYAVLLPVVMLQSGVYQDFDGAGAGTPYAVGVHLDTVAGPEVLPGGPSQEGSFLRLAFAEPVTNHNSIAFARTDRVSFTQIVVDFDFRMRPGSGQADGFGFAFLNTAHYGDAGSVAPIGPLFAGEEPNFVGSIGVGFDIYQSTTDSIEVSDNHLSIHYDGSLVQEFDVTSSINLASGLWTHARIILRPGGGRSDVTVELTECGGSAQRLIQDFSVTGFEPYVGRAYFVARSGGLSADHDLDNVRIRFQSGGEAEPPSVDECNPETRQDFEPTRGGTPYAHWADPISASLPPSLTVGGPTERGHFLRLGYGGEKVNHNTITFDRTKVGAAGLIVTDFDLRLRPGMGRADGMGFAFLNTEQYGTSGSQPPSAVAEEPNFAGSLGIGFDIFRSGDMTTGFEVNDNHVSIHFDHQLVAEVDAQRVLDLGGGEWIHVRIVMRPGGGHSDVSVILAACGRPPVVLVDALKVAGFRPYEGRVYLGARSGGSTADQDVDNVRVQYVAAGQSVLGFEQGCYGALENSGVVSLTVRRADVVTGQARGTVTVDYETVDGSARAGVDYEARAGTLTFTPSEVTQTIPIPLIDHGEQDGTRAFSVALRHVRGDSARLGGPAETLITIADDETAQQMGLWSEVIPAGVVPIHMQLLPTGKVLYWDRHEERGWDGHPHLWDPETGEVTQTAAVGYDIFCSGHAFLSDGRLLVAGGHISDTIGEIKASIYDPVLDSWTQIDNMNAGRWYPSNVTLASGDVLVMAGTTLTETGPYAPHGLNLLPQVWEVANNEWRDLETAQLSPATFTAVAETVTGSREVSARVDADYYPFLYVAPNGQVFYAGPQQRTRYLDTTGSGTWTEVASSSLPYRDYGSSVMYDEGKVLIVGGNPRDPEVDTNPSIPPSASAEVIDLNGANPVWLATNSMHVGRRHHNATLLPDGSVLVTGGSSAPGFDNEAGAVLAAEVWNPQTGEWKVMAAQTRYRGYHSTALLLADGRVLVGGGGHPDPAGGAQYNFEIYSPPYLFKGVRPVITAAPPGVSYGQTFVVQTPDAATIESVTWLRLGAVTHAFNQNQRINHLAFAKTGSELTVTAPANAKLAPPGHYLLFILNGQGVPSRAALVQVGE